MVKDRNIVTMADW